MKRTPTSAALGPPGGPPFSVLCSQAAEARTPLEGKRQERPYGIKETQRPGQPSRVKGSPEPPHPYRIERAFFQAGLQETHCTSRNAPGSNRLFVTEHGGQDALLSE